MPTFTPLPLPSAHSRLTYYRQGRNSVSNFESLERRCSLGMQRVLGQLGTRLDMRIQGPRAQIDRKLYKRHMQETLFNYPNLDVRAGSVFDLILDHTAASNGTAGPNFALHGVRLGNELPFAFGILNNNVAFQILGISSSVNQSLSAQALSYPGRSTSVELINPSQWLYLTRREGLKRFPAGRMNESPSVGLSASLRSAGFKLGRLQTGTPARLYKPTINFDQLAVQRGDDSPTPFSYLNATVDNAVCYTT